MPGLSIVCSLFCRSESPTFQTISVAMKLSGLRLEENGHELETRSSIRWPSEFDTNQVIVWLILRNGFIFFFFSGVPHSPSDLLTFLSEVHDHRQEKDLQAQRPLVVHCR